MAGEWWKAAFGKILNAGVELDLAGGLNFKNGVKATRNDAAGTIDIELDDAGTAVIADGAVTTDKLDDEAVTAAKLAANSVTNAKMADNAIDTAELVDEAVTAAKIEDGAIGAVKLDAYAGAYATYSALRTALAAGEMAAGDTVRVASRATAGDGGHGEFRIAAIGSYVDNDGTIFTGGSFAALRKIEGPIYPEWFGAVGDGATDDAQEFQKCIDLLGSAGGTIALTPGKTYMISTTVDLQEAYRIRIDGQGALIRINDSLGSSSAFNLQSAKYCKLENLRVLVEEAFSGIVFDLRGQLDPEPYTDTQYCSLRGIEVAGTGTGDSHDAAAIVALGGAVNCSVSRSVLVGGIHQITGLETADDPSRRGYSNVIAVKRCTFAQHDDYSVRNLGDSWSFETCTFAQSKDGLARAIKHDDATNNAYALTVQGCWFGDVQDTGGSGDWIYLERTLGIKIAGNFIYAPNGSCIRIRDACAGVNIFGNQLGGPSGFGVKFDPASGVVVGVNVVSNNVTASTPISGRNSCILYRFESNGGVANYCYGFNITQESTQENDSYLHLGIKTTTLASNYLSGLIAMAFGVSGFNTGSLVLFPSTHTAQDGRVYIGTRDGSNVPTTRLEIARTYVDLVSGTPIGVSAYALSGVPAASSHSGRVIAVTDGDFGQPCLARSNGTNWICTRSGLPIASAAYTNAASAPSSGIAPGASAYFSTGAAGSPCLGFWDGAAWKRAELPGTSVS